MSRVVAGTKLIDASYRRIHTKQERSKVVDAQEQGVQVRGKRSPANIPTNWDDIHIDKAKRIPYNRIDDKPECRCWKAKAKCRKQWERKGNIVFVGRNRNWEKVSLEKKDKEGKIR